MNRRTFNALAAFGFGLPLLARPARAVELPTIAGRGADAGAALSADEIVARVAAFYEKTVTFKANFSEPSSLPPWKKTGSVIFERPGKMSWRYAGSGNRVVSDGARIKVYEAQCQQLYEQELALDVDMRSFEVRRVQLSDLRGNRSVFNFAASKLNPRVPAGEFEFSPPRGTRLIST